MAARTRDGRTEGVEFVHEEDGRITARDIESGVASFGETKSEALRKLAEALDSHEGRGERIDDPEAHLKERGVDTSERASE